MVALAYYHLCIVGYYYYLITFLISFAAMLDPYTFSLHFSHFVIPLKGTIVMSGHAYATHFLSHWTSYVPSMEHCRIPLVLSRQAHFFSPHDH